MPKHLHNLIRRVGRVLRGLLPDPVACAGGFTEHTGAFLHVRDLIDDPPPMWFHSTETRVVARGYRPEPAPRRRAQLPLFPGRPGAASKGPVPTGAGGLHATGTQGQGDEGTKEPREASSSVPTSLRPSVPSGLFPLRHQAWRAPARRAGAFCFVIRACH